MKFSGVPRPDTTGFFAAALTGCAFLGGLAVSELVLLLTGGILAGLLVYTFVALAVLSRIHRKRVLAIGAGLSPAVLAAGDSAELRLKVPVKIFELPGCLVRYRLCLRASSGRTIVRVFPFKLFSGIPCPFNAGYRGAYFGERDEIVFFDFFGFWKAVIPLPQSAAARLCVCPVRLPAIDQPDFAAGGNGERRGQSAVKTEEFYDNRPYIPGDDPRRLNWKLYGHSGELFVREALRQTPPNACLTIVVDTETDAGLFSGEAALHAVDLLCSAALSFAVFSAERGIGVRLLRTDAAVGGAAEAAFANAGFSFGGNGGGEGAGGGSTAAAGVEQAGGRSTAAVGERAAGRSMARDVETAGVRSAAVEVSGVGLAGGEEALEGGRGVETARLERELSFPAAIPLGQGGGVSTTAIEGGGGIFYLALPRAADSAEKTGRVESALDRFLAGSNRGAGGAQKSIKMIFIYPKNIYRGVSQKIEYTAYANTLYYGSKGGAGAESIGV